jgi:O-antigen/teichoic acid export membrane protein
MAGSGAVQIAGMALTFLVGVQLARGLGVEGYGQYGIAMAVITLAGIPGEFGIPKLVVRETAAAAGRKDWPAFFGVLHWANTSCWLVSSAIALAAAAGVFLFLDEPTAGVGAAILLGAPIIPLFALAKIRGAALQGLHHVVIGQVPAVVLRPLLYSLLLFLLFSAMPNAGASDAMALNIATAAAVLIVAELLLRPRLPATRPERLETHGRRWLRSAIPIGLSDSLVSIQSQFTLLLLGLLSTLGEVGLFRIALSISAVVAVPLLLTNSVISPVLARLFADEDFVRIQKLCTRAAQAMTVAVLVLSLPLLLWGRPLIAFVFGAEFAPALPALLVMIGGIVISAAFGPNSVILNMTHHERRVTKAVLLGLLAGIATAVALMPSWGDLGAAAAMLVWQFVWNLLTWLDARRLLGVDTSLLPARS